MPKASLPYHLRAQANSSSLKYMRTTFMIINNEKKNCLTLRNGAKLLKHEKDFISNQQTVAFQVLKFSNYFD